MATTTSKERPIRHFLTWDPDSGEIRFFRSASALVGSYPGRTDVLYFSPEGMLDLSAPIRDYFDTHLATIGLDHTSKYILSRDGHTLREPEPFKHVREAFSAFIEQLVANHGQPPVDPDSAH